MNTKNIVQEVIAKAKQLQVGEIAATRREAAELLAVHGQNLVMAAVMIEQLQAELRAAQTRNALAERMAKDITAHAAREQVGPNV